MKTLVTSILSFAFAAGLGSAVLAHDATPANGAAAAHHEESATPHYPLKD
ncbi:cytochrome c1, partial [Rhizobium ruizarguesonis]